MSPARFAAGAVQEITGLLVLAYVLSRRRSGFRDLGLRWALRDVAIGLLLLIVAAMFYFAGATAIQLIHHGLYGAYAHITPARKIFGRPSAATIPYLLLNPFFEEMIVRAYLMTEVQALTGSAALAVVLSVLVQSSYHLYYGWAGAFSIAFLFLPFALYYARWKRILPVIVSHEIFDIVGLIIISMS